MKCMPTRSPPFSRINTTTLSYLSSHPYRMASLSLPLVVINCSRHAGTASASYLACSLASRQSKRTFPTYGARFSSKLSIAINRTRKANGLPHHCRAAAQDSSPPPNEVYQGVYGPWSIDSSDVREVVLYRGGLVTSAVTFVIAASSAFMMDDNPMKSLIREQSGILYGVGAGGLGLSLLLIHIYVTPIKRTLQLLWLVGVLGSTVVTFNYAAPVNEGLVEYILNNPSAIWFVGPLFAALTGLVFKEGLCYGKLEAAALVFVIPALLLGHLSGHMDEKLKLGLLAAWMILFIVFSARKFIQPVKDDIGDKSIFMFNALAEEERKVLLSKIQEQSRHDA